MQLEKIYREIDRRKSQHLKDLKKLLQQPSVSPQNIGVKECAKLVAQYFKRLGCQSVKIVPTKGNPVVYGKYDASAKRTLIAYLMYDIQPYDEPGWTHDPMGAKLVPMKLPSGPVKALVNRGAYNSKGPLMAFLHAIESIRDVEGELPFNLLLVAEGEEELGSPHLPDFVKEYKKELSKADACFFPFFSQDQYGKPKLDLGNKGIIYFELECSGKAWGRGPEEFDIHSSMKTWMDSPVWRLIHALASMTDETGNHIAIDGFYDDVSPPPSDEKALLKKLIQTFEPRSIKESLKVSRFSVDEKDKEALLRAYLYGTTLNIDGIWGGYIGPGSKTVLPHKVIAKLDIRMVPHQKPERMLKLVRAHLDKHGYRDIKIRAMDAYSWAQTDPKAPIVRAVIQACRDFRHEPELWPRIGGSAPFYLFTEVLKIPFAMGVLGHGSRAHSPDEYIVWEGNQKVAGYDGAVKSMVAFLDHYISS